VPPPRPPSISTHVLDNERGQPASGVRVTLERRDGGGFALLAEGTTDADGRIAELLAPSELQAGVYRIGFDAAAYFAARGGEPPFIRTVAIEFEIHDPSRHYHVPLLLTRYACTSYRGS
jgi:5-hydroxyisourate hydrolase